MKTPSVSTKPTATTPGRRRSCQLELVEAHGFAGSPAAPLVVGVVAEPERAERQHEPREHRVVERGLEVEAGLGRVQPVLVVARGDDDRRAAPGGRSPGTSTTTAASSSA